MNDTNELYSFRMNKLEEEFKDMRKSLEKLNIDVELIKAKVITFSSVIALVVPLFVDFIMNKLK